MANLAVGGHEHDKAARRAVRDEEVEALAWVPAVAEALAPPPAGRRPEVPGERVPSRRIVVAVGDVRRVGVGVSQSAIMPALSYDAVGMAQL